ncbi:2-dehydro-3,6-dideoxy-6-sulfogluconate aldolase [Arthrobacter sp. Bi83]|jgi:4-hydroxy-2-oxoheptanedioate aldolase|uniref:HpcH/HpaI aldolase family protein n=1 Tax=Arthrobacter sp. Bi83 TaxID=2822353 RepID=UPI001DE36B57|nr:aldolase/citrate lyase family protein [Arthrobacter sp. Bi83]CAH0290719.1 2-dehydro-3,6-dideoxy-6-sulfogluconate aldolase [Arthrobacter sp. Bi83]
MKIYGESERNSGLRTPRLILDDGEIHAGAWVSFRDPAVVDTLAAEGFGWICVDGQHGGPETHEMQPLIEAAHLFSVPSIVRVPGHDMGIIGRILDAGAGAIIFPTVENAASAASLIAACRFPPRGNRSYGPTRRSPRYPKPATGNPQDDTLCILMIETAAGLANLDEILATGPDGIFVGPYDLSLSLGVTLEELTGEGPDGILADIARRCTAAGVTPGIYTGEPELSERMAALGFRFMPTASDTGLLSVAARNAVAASRQVNAAKVMS